MITSDKSESDKTELSLEINSFDKPKELTDIKAWSQLMLNLIFLTPGTYPSQPEMGIGLERYQYDFADSVVAELSSKISLQHQTYLPDVPLTSLQLSTTKHNGETILIIQMVFTTKSKNNTSVIAINTSKKNFLDFNVSW